LKGPVTNLGKLHNMGSAAYSCGKNQGNFNGSPNWWWQTGKCCTRKNENHSSVNICFSLWYIWMAALLLHLLARPYYPTFGYPTFHLMLRSRVTCYLQICAALAYTN